MQNLSIIESRILGINKLNSLLAVWRFQNNQIVFTNGCFDIIHLGHIDYLSKAKDLGDILILGLNTDQSVARIKGKNRPVNNQLSRSMILASLNFIDAVVLFDEDTPFELIKLIEPDILVKGSDYKANDILGADIVQAKGGRIETIQFLEGYSTSSIINKIRDIT